MQARRLTLVPFHRREERLMDRHGSRHQDRRIPLILRRVPPERCHLARCLVGPVDTDDGVWWEVVDAAAAEQMPAAGVALLRRDSVGCVTVCAVGVRPVDPARADPAVAYADLFRALIADLRAHAVDLMTARSADPDVVRALIAVGFTPMPGEDHRYDLAL